MKLEIYRIFETGWAFDDASRDIIQEPFVSGIPEIINHYVPENIERAILTFSPLPFPGYTISLSLDKAKAKDLETWYIDDNTGMRGWLCSVLFQYMNPAPAKIYAKLEPINGD